MKCQNCGEEIPDSAKVCGNCGTKQVSKPTGKTCPNCQSEVPFEAKVCGNCGNKFEPEVLEQVEPIVPLKAAKPVKPARKKKPDKKPEPYAEPGMAAETAPAMAAVSEEETLTPLSVVEKHALPTSKKPKWLFPAFIGLIVVLAIAAYAIFFTKASLDDMNKIFWRCDRETAFVGEPVAVIFKWAAATTQQLDDFFRVSEFKIQINGKPVAVKNSGFFDDEPHDLGVVRSIWLSIGKLQPGEYRVATHVDVNEQVYDGLDTYGPGYMDKFDAECLLVVE